MLTQKQFELLKLLEKKIEESGFAPSFEEMKDSLGLRSKSGIHRLICGLEERGFLRKLPHRARSIEVLRSPSSFKKKKRTKKSSIPHKSKSSHPLSQNIRSIPLVGKIAAGSPIEAVKNSSDLIDIPESLLGSGSYFALNVVGDSMIDIGIHEGDIAIIEQKDDAKNGDLVVALIDETEVTLKRLNRFKGKIILEAENKSYSPQVYEKETDVRVQGTLSSIIRKYQ